MEIWGFHQPGRASELCEAYGIPWKVIPVPWSHGRMKGSNKIGRAFLYASRRIQRTVGIGRYTLALRHAKPDVILPYTMFPNMICGLTWRKAGARLCIWNQRDEGRGRMGQELENSVIPRIPIFVSNSQHGADFLVNDLHAKAGRVHVIHNGVELTGPVMGRAEWRNQLGLDDDCFVACMVANLTRVKDHQTLIMAWRQVVDQMQKDNRQAVLLLAGRKDATYDSLATLTNELKLDGNVLFLDRVDDINGLLNAIDLGIHSSLLEGLPNSILEIMAAGLAVVATDIPGIREALGDEGLDFLVEAKNPGEMAEKILLLANDPSLRQSEGTRNKRRIREEFSPEKMCEETVDLISKALVKK